MRRRGFLKIMSGAIALPLISKIPDISGEALASTPELVTSGKDKHANEILQFKVYMQRMDGEKIHEIYELPCKRVDVKGGWEYLPIDDLDIMSVNEDLYITGADAGITTLPGDVVWVSLPFPTAYVQRGDNVHFKWHGGKILEITF